MPKNKGNRGTQAILGNRKHRKSRFCFLGNKGTIPFFFEGTREKVAPPPGRASILAISVRRVSEKYEKIILFAFIFFISYFGKTFLIASSQ